METEIYRVEYGWFDSFYMTEPNGQVTLVARPTICDYDIEEQGVEKIEIFYDDGVVIYFNDKKRKVINSPYIQYFIRPVKGEDKEK